MSKSLKIIMMAEHEKFSEGKTSIKIKQTLLEVVRDEIKKAIKDVYGIDENVPLPEKPKRPLGDVASDICLKLAPKLKKSPVEIAGKIAEKLPFVDNTTGGFLNIKIPDELFIRWIVPIFEGGKLGKLDGKRVLLEFLSANPTGPLHIGHGRIGVVGDSIGRVLEFCSAKVDREYYVNNMGEQIRKLGESILGQGKEYKASYTEKVRKWLEEEGKLDGDAKRVGLEASKLILERIIKPTIKRLRIEFRAEKKFANSDIKLPFVFETEIHDKYFKKVKEILEGKGLLYRDDRAIFFKSKSHNIVDYKDTEDRVFIKSDGNPTYFANDCAHHYWKIEQGYDELLNVWGADHHGYIPRMKVFVEVMKKLMKANFDFEVVTVQMVNLVKDGEKVQMSKREGTFVTVDEVIDAIKEGIEGSDEERERFAVDAVRFIYLTKTRDTHLDFDINIAKLKSEKNPVWYVQYVHARCSSVMREAEKRGYLADYEKFKEKLVCGEGNVRFEEDERQIMAECALFWDRVWLCAQMREPFVIVSWLTQLARMFHSFYQKTRILVEDNETRSRRLFLVDTVKSFVAKGLELVGVTAPEKM